MSQASTFFTEQSLTPENLFVTLSLLFAGSYTFIGQFALGASYFAEAFIAIKRIQEFLNTNELAKTSISRQPTRKGHVLAMKRVSAGWTNQLATLRSCDFGLKKGELGVVIGPVGSGKVLKSTVRGTIMKTPVNC